jgi:hypothetical protein
MQKLGSQLLDLGRRQLTIEQIQVLRRRFVVARPHRHKVLCHDSSVIEPAAIALVLADFAGCSFRASHEKSTQQNEKYRSAEGKTAARRRMMPGYSTVIA